MWAGFSKPIIKENKSNICERCGVYFKRKSKVCKPCSADLRTEYQTQRMREVRKLRREKTI